MSVCMVVHEQPPMTEFWEEGLGPHKPVIRDGKLYGRGYACVSVHDMNIYARVYIYRDGKLCGRLCVCLYQCYPCIYHPNLY
jgi:hypothetical protein